MQWNILTSGCHYCFSKIIAQDLIVPPRINVVVYFHVDALKADDVCYERGNVRGDVHGFCKIISELTSSYLACVPE